MANNQSLKYMCLSKVKVFQGLKTKFLEQVCALLFWCCIKLLLKHFIESTVTTIETIITISY